MENSIQASPFAPPSSWRVNGDFQSDLSTLEFNNREQLEDFHRRIIILQQEIIICGESISPTRLLFQYMKEFPNSNKLKTLITPEMTYIIRFLNNNKNYSV